MSLRRAACALWAATGCLALAAVPPATPAPPWGDEVELLVFSRPRPARVSLRVEIEGRPIGAVWDSAVGKLFDFLDRDGDGSLSAAEAARLPTPFELRRLLWGIYHAPAGVGEGWNVDAGSSHQGPQPVEGRGSGRAKARRGGARR